MVGETISHYRITEKLGEGGMGVVYKAEDTRLHRTVALKFVKGGEEELRRRFVQEAEAAASLHHPNICTVFEIDEERGFLAAEYVEGQTLKERIAARPLPLKEAIDITTQLGLGLQAAHEKGVTHRDIKPANVMVTAQGAVKIMDFGLARLADRTRLTRTGTAVGTPAYMSPEQTSGGTVDHRTDIWAMGMVLYEMLTGSVPFSGENEAAVAHSILYQEVEPVTARRSGVPVEIDRVVAKALAKDAGARYQHVDDLLVDLRQLARGASDSRDSGTNAGRPPTRRWVWVAVAALCFTAGVVASALYFRETPAAAPIYRFAVHPPEKSTFDSFALSPDGRRLAMSVMTAGKRALWIRSLDSVSAQPIEGTEDAYNPFWSADGRSIGFFTLGLMKTIDVSVPGASIAPITRFTGETHVQASGAWNRQGVIVYNAINDSPLHVLQAGGDTRTALTVLDRSRLETLHMAPQFLPDGRRFLFAARSARQDTTATFAASLDRPQAERVLDGQARATHFGAYVVVQRGGTLAAQAFDSNGLKPTGDSYVLADRVGAFAVSETGVLAYQGSVQVSRRLVWLDRQGRETDAYPPFEGLNDVSLAPDGKIAAVVVGADVWLIDLPRQTRTRFTFHPYRRQGGLVWSPDGTRLVFGSDPNGTFNMMERSVGKSADERPLLPHGIGRAATSWSRDGRFLIYHEYDSKVGWDLWVLPMPGERTPVPLLQTEFSERQGQLSPDGRWLAYTSDESGERQIYVRAFRVSAEGAPSLEGKWPVSNDGGHSPKWRPDGRELFYIGEDRKLKAVEVKPGASFDAGPPRPLFELNNYVTSANWVYRYDVSADGQRFLADGITESTEPSPITVVLNWASGLKGR